MATDARVSWIEFDPTVSTTLDVRVSWVEFDPASSVTTHTFVVAPSTQAQTSAGVAVVLPVSHHYLTVEPSNQAQYSTSVRVTSHDVASEMYGLPANIQKLNPGDIVTLFELDTTNYAGGELFRFHAGTNGQLSTLYWRGNPYAPLPIEADGFEWRGQGTLPHPTLRVANITGLLGAAVREMNDLVGCKVTRRRTFAKYMDAINFPDGLNPLEDWEAEFPVDVFYVHRKVAENKVLIEFELASAMEVQGVKLPRRQVIANLCPWRYRGAECGYTGGAVADAMDQPTTNLNLDVCGKRLGSCEMRHDKQLGLPFGGFVGAGLVRR